MSPVAADQTARRNGPYGPGLRTMHRRPRHPRDRTPIPPIHRMPTRPPIRPEWLPPRPPAPRAPSRRPPIRRRGPRDQAARRDAATVRPAPAADRLARPDNRRAAQTVGRETTTETETAIMGTGMAADLPATGDPPGSLAPRERGVARQDDVRLCMHT